MKTEIKLSEIVKMWGTNDERIGIELENGDVYFVEEARTFNQYIMGNFSKR
jgi:hypothetical protein